MFIDPGRIQIPGLRRSEIFPATSTSDRQHAARPDLAEKIEAPAIYKHFVLSGPGDYSQLTTDDHHFSFSLLFRHKARLRSLRYRPGASWRTTSGDEG
jgi:hypothetical protein